METRGWSCVLGFLCLPAEVLLHTWTVSQEPSSISIKKVNSSAEITCSSSLSDPVNLILERRFHSGEEVMFLYLKNGKIAKKTPNAEFKPRVHVSERKQLDGGLGITFKISLLQLHDTNLYYCIWTYMYEDVSPMKLQTNGTIIIVRERELQENCGSHTMNLVLIGFSVTAFIIILFLCTGAMILRRKRFKKRFIPGRPVEAPRPPRPQHLCPQHQPYLMTSVSTLDFRGIL
ncbi:hypothetical protein PBY51_001310 [Eleginops maclovinus]|uniref:Immunoglobulin V-set domain-containing protein n=1 Tax=Eleginops maclovinus TaxID=56733 RepID=A0AAN7WP75_ELEMC|nr:hypothetical protein PBY51_001310 [Eleginops maclovinus]